MSDYAQQTAQVVIKKDYLNKSEEIQRRFSNAGFAVGPFVGTSFAITGPKTLFDRHLEGQTGSLENAESPCESLHEGVDDIVQTKVDFGPTSW